MESTRKGLSTAKTHVTSLAQDFKKFIQRGNVVDLAVGIVMGAAFTAIVTSIVTDLFTPIIGLAIGSQLKEAFVLFKCGFEPNSTTVRLAKCSSSDYNTIAEANKQGAVTWNYGNFIQTVINFVIISVIVFVIVKLYTQMDRPKKQEPDTKECKFCLSQVPLKSLKCKFCCSTLDSLALEP